MMQTKGFSIGEMLKFGWQTMKDNISFFIGIVLTTFVISNLPYLLGLAAKIPQDSLTLSNILISLLGIILGLWMALGIINIALMFARGEKAQFRDLFSRYDLLWNYFLATLLFTLLLIAGFILLIFPMFIWGAKYGLYPYFIVEKGASALESLKLSAETTMGAKWDVAGLWIALVILNLLGALCLGVGLLVTLPITWVACAYAYRRLLSQTHEIY